MIKIFILLVIVSLFIPHLTATYSMLIRKKSKSVNQTLEQQHVGSESLPRFDAATTFGSTIGIVLQVKRDKNYAEISSPVKFV